MDLVRVNARGLNTKSLLRGQTDRQREALENLAGVKAKGLDTYESYEQISSDTLIVRHTIRPSWVRG